jgi:oxygen-dependent protoporphyrinogen oxidase
LLGEAGKDLAPVADSIPGNNLCVVTGAWRRDQVQNDLQSFGFIALRNHGFRPLGVQYASSIFPDQSPSDMVQLRVLIGGSFDQNVAELNDQELQAEAFGPLHKLLGVQGDPERVWIRRVAGGIPQYTVGHLDRVAAFDSMEKNMPGLHFAGDSLHGVGVNAVLKRSLVVADRLHPIG